MCVQRRCLSKSLSAQRTSCRASTLIGQRKLRNQDSLDDPRCIESCPLNLTVDLARVNVPQDALCKLLAALEKANPEMQVLLERCTILQPDAAVVRALLEGRPLAPFLAPIPAIVPPSPATQRPRFDGVLKAGDCVFCTFFDKKQCVVHIEDPTTVSFAFQR